MVEVVTTARALVCQRATAECLLERYNAATNLIESQKRAMGSTLTQPITSAPSMTHLRSSPSHRQAPDNATTVLRFTYCVSFQHKKNNYDVVVTQNT